MRISIIALQNLRLELFRLADLLGIQPNKKWVKQFVPVKWAVEPIKTQSITKLF